MIEKDKRENLICLGLLIGSLAILLWRCFFGIDWSDESFYIAATNRLYMGARVLVDDWNPAQISSILMIPLLALFRMITGGTEGIILYFRLCYWILLLVTSLFMYKTMSEFCKKKVALLSTLFYLFYARFTIVTLSYNTIAVSFLLLAILLLYREWKKERFSRGAIFVSGICLSISVVATPYLAFLYVVFCVFLFTLFCQYKNNSIRAKIIKTFLYSLYGVIVSVIIFLIYIFSKISLQELLYYLPNLVEEPEYERASALRMIFRMFGAVLRRYTVMLIPYLFCVIISIWYKWKWVKIPNKVQNIILWVQLAVLIVEIVQSGLKNNLGISFIGFAMFGLQIFIFQESLDWKNVLCWYVIGLISAVCFFFSSNTGIYAIATGCLYSAIATLYAWDEFADKRKTAKMDWLNRGVNIVICVILLTTIYMRVGYVYRDYPVWKLNEKITEGPYAGIYTVKEYKDEYMEIYDVILENITDDDKVIFSRLLPWGYLCTDAECAATATWRTNMDEDRIGKYYQVHPDKVATKILVLNELYGYGNGGNDIAGYMKGLLESGEYEKEEYKCGVLYSKK